MTPAPDSLRVEIQAVVAVDAAQMLAVAGGARLRTVLMLVAVKAAATTAVAHAPPTPVSHGKTQVMAQVTAPVMVARHVANVAH